MMKHLVLTMIVIGLSACAGKWSGAPTATYPNARFETKVQWLKESADKFEITAIATGLRCCMIPEDEIRNPVIEAGRQKAHDLCGPREAVLANENYEAAYQMFSAQVGCR